MRWALVAIVVGACYRPSTEPPCEVHCSVNPADPADRGPCPLGLACGSDGLCRAADGTCGPGGTDGGPDDTSRLTCVGSMAGVFRPCIPAPSGLLALMSTIDTDTDPRCITVSQGAPADDVCVIAADSITTSNVVGIGSRPLVLVALTAISVTGTLDVSSHRVNSVRGAGANFHGCVAAGLPNDAAGGAGGSFQTLGGDGGSSAGNPGGVAGPVSAASLVRGGCPGEDGENNAGAALGAGGVGGGAIYLIAGDRIDLDGKIDASGQGGQGAGVVSGGGGGGSGGLVGLDAPVVTMTGTSSILANGGGAGEGGSSGSLGQNGGESLGFSTAAAGGNSGAGGRGGNGAIATSNGSSGTSVATGFGAGGGGGGMGTLLVISTSVLSGSTSPPASPP